MPTDAWVVEESGFDPERANFFETLFTVGNGRLGTRGSLEEGHLGQLSGTFLAGVYDGHDVPVIDLVNAPDWVDTDGLRRRRPPRRRHLHGRRPTTAALDLRDGLLTRSTVFEDAEGRRTRLETMRCASMADRRVCALRVEVTPENHAAEIRVETGIDGDRRNLERLPLYPEGTVFPPETRWEKWARARHLEESSRSAEGEVLYLEMRTIDTGVDLGYAAATTYEPPPQQRVGSAAQRADHRGDRAPSARRARRCGWTSSSPSAPRATRTVRHRDPARPVPGGARRAPRGRVRRRRRREPRGVGAPVGRVRLRGRRQRAVHPRPAVLRLPPADRREPGGPDSQHRGERAGRGALPGPRVLGHRDLPAALLHPHPARHRQGAAALPPPHPGRRPGELPRVRHRRGPVRRGSPPTPVGRSALSSPPTGPTGSGRGRRRSTSPPTSPTGSSGTSRRPATPRSCTTSAPRSCSRRAASGSTASYPRPTARATSCARSWARTSSTPTSTTTPSPTASPSGTSTQAVPCTTTCVTAMPEAIAALESRHRPRADGTGSLAGGRRRARRRPVQGRGHRAVHRLLRARRRAHRRVGREQHAALPEGLPPLQLREHPTAQAARRRHADVPAAGRVRAATSRRRASSTTRPGRCTSRR